MNGSPKLILSLLSCLLWITHGSIPISYDGATSLPYNLIDTNIECWYNGSYKRF